VARHNIFMTNVRPSIESEFRDYRFGFINIASNQLIAMPFRCITNISLKHSSRTLFNFDAKIKSVEPLVVGDDSKAITKTSAGLSLAYAFMINNAGLLKQDLAGRYPLLSRNFSQAAEALDGLGDYQLIKERFEALAILSDGIDNVINNKCQEAAPKLKGGIKLLSDVKTKAQGNLDFGAMVNPITKEEVVGRTVLSIAEAVNRSPELDSGNILTAVQNIVNELDNQEKSCGGQWDVFLKRPERYTDVFTELGKIIDSKAGAGKIKMAKGSDGVLIPFWILEINYSFVTGSIKKKSVEVKETVLLSALFTTGAETMNNSRNAITDIFSSRPETKFLDGFKGNETSISMGGDVKSLVDSAADGSAVNLKVAVPLSTRQEAELQCNNYLNACKQTHPKLKMGASVAKGLVFIPCKISGTSIQLSANLGSMAPKVVGYSSKIEKMTI
jgi:hypothetical protein